MREIDRNAEVTTDAEPRALFSVVTDIGRLPGLERRDREGDRTTACSCPR
jgi:hypothetical protein